MSVEIRVPQLPESVADATLVAWRKSLGESVSRDENLADLETDKVMLELPAPVTGVLRELKVPAGTTVRSGELLAVIEEGAAGTAAGAAAGKAAPAKGPAAAGTVAAGGAASGTAVSATATGPSSAASAAGDGRAGPAARR